MFNESDILLSHILAVFIRNNLGLKHTLHVLVMESFMFPNQIYNWLVDYLFILQVVFVMFLNSMYPGYFTEKLSIKLFQLCTNGHLLSIKWLQ
jgi:hypothetical protein